MISISNATLVLKQRPGGTRKWPIYRRWASFTTMNQSINQSYSPKTRNTFSKKSREAKRVSSENKK